MTAAIPRPEYPRPQLVRDTWVNLNGEWEFEFDDARVGDAERWYEAGAFARRIQVPFAFQSALSGIGDPGFHELVWYRKKVKFPKSFQGKSVILHFGAVDYRADVWVNGRYVTSHEGGHTPFSADITVALKGGENVIVVRAEDFDRDMTIPRGKQYWEEKSAVIWYTRTTGIWQTVWAEAVDRAYVKKIRYTPDIDTNEIRIKATVGGHRPDADLRLTIDISFEGERVASDEIKLRNAEETRCVKLKDFNDHGRGRWWSPEKPNLYDARFTLTLDGLVVDTVDSYFGMRKISVEHGKLSLNNRPKFMRMVLDQGYFPDGNLTPPSDEAIRKDVELTKAMGFNGSRKHQKVEDPRFLYWCDKLGLMVWGEMANACDYSEAYVERITKEWLEAVDRDYNHPCIVAWVPMNESWGVPNVLIDKRQQNHLQALYYLTKSIDSTRLVVSNDGWEQATTDLCTIHDYESRREVLERRYSTEESAVTSTPASREIYIGEYRYRGEPVLVSEFGGISFKKSEWEGWGYSGAENDEDFLSRLQAVVAPLLATPAVQGFCYTQLTDVEQEINGLLTYDRSPKVPLEKIREIFGAPKERK